MTDSPGREPLEGKREQRRSQRPAAIKRWVEHIRATPPELWEPEQNAVGNAQVEVARSADLDAEHYERVEGIARELADRDE